MSLIKFLIKDVDVTVLGNFNPAILRHDFLVKECKIIDLGQVIEQSPPQLPMVSHIKYKDVWWTAELTRMIVRDLSLSNKAPNLLSKYLEALPHTPLLAAGINLVADLVISDIPVATSKMLNTTSLFEILRKFEATQIYMTVKYQVVSNVSSVPMEYLLNFVGRHESRVLVQMELGKAPFLRARYNWEIRGIDINRSRLQLIQGEYERVKEDFQSLIQEFLENRQDSEE
jgi:hypothetical protein